MPHTQDPVKLSLEILKRIPRYGKVSASELHRQLQGAGYGRTLRSIQRQLDALCQQFDIECDDSSKPYGYRWKAQAQGLSLPGLSLQEAVVLNLAKQYLHSVLPSSIVQSMSGFFAQAESSLKAVQWDASGQTARRSKDQQWPQKVRLIGSAMPLLPAPIKPDLLSAVTEALYRDQWLNIEYRNSQGKRTRATIMPLGLAQQEARTYLVCRFEGYDNERSLALHRILSAENTPHHFERPKDFDLNQYQADGRFAFGNGQTTRLHFKIKKSAGLHLLESRLSKDQIVIEHADHYEITATVVNSILLKRWILSFGQDIEVLSDAK